MIPDLKPYPAMKDSGVEWLGAVPEHWEVRRLRNTSEMRVSNVDKHAKDDEQPVRLCNYVDVYKNERIRSGMAFMRATATTDEIERFRLQSGDVLITKDSEAWNDIGVPALVEDTQDDIVSGYHLALLRPFPERVDGGYLFRALQSTAVTYQFHVEANGVTRYGLSHSAIKSVWLPLAPLPEQAAIVRFLDHADRRIRRYIRAKQKLITLLEEQKQAVIHRAVTRGLDPNVRLKPSGVEWLGDVPEHWEVVRLRHVLRRHTERERPDLPLLSVVREQGVILRDTTSTDENHNYIPDDLSNYKVVRAGQFAMNKMKAWQGSYGVSCHDGIVSPAYFVFDVLGLEVDFFHAAIRSRAYVPAFTRASDGVRIGQWDLAEARMREIQFLVPPAAEQAAIVSFLDRTTAALDAATTSAQRETSLLREYRTCLIADVVTGKLDVREAAAGLPDEVKESEPFDETSALIDGEEEPTDALATVP